MYIRGRGKIGYLTGEKAEPNAKDSAHATWDGKNSMVMAWLVNAMEEDINANYLGYSNAKDMWDNLNQMYSDLGPIPEPVLTSELLSDPRLEPNLNQPVLHSCKNLTYLQLSNNQIEKVVFPKGLDSCKNLKYLDLAFNRIEKVVFPKGLDKLSTLTNLEFLDLGYNMFNNDILSSINALPSLTTLYLYYNRLNEIVDLQGLDSLNNLSDLDVSFNPIEKFIFPKGSTGLRKLKTLDLSGLNVINGSSLLQSLGSFPSLKTLYLSYSQFSDSTTNRDYLHNLTNVEELILDESFLHISLLQSIAAFTSLNSLSMSNCHINGILGFQGLCKCVHLQELDLSHNNLMGTLPSCFANLTSLRVLDVSSNKFAGDISSSPVKSLISIQDLRLSNNHFQIPVSLAPLFNLSELKKFYGENNDIINAEIESHSSVPKFQLNTIMLSCCGDGGKLPEFLHHQHDIRKVDLSHNNLTGDFPNWLLENNTKLEYLVLANNSLAGLLQLPNHSLMGLTTLDISHNLVQGHIPKEIGEYLPSLTTLDISHNLFQGHIPKEIGEYLPSLTTLDISHNLFQGHIPKEIGEYLPGLKGLNLSRNAFDGSIPSSIGDMNSLESLDLSFNQLSGEIPDHLAEGCTSLQLLVLSNNSLQGQIFSTNFNLTNLLRLQLDSNNFTGRIPDSLSKASNLAGLYLSDNNISGGIPSWLGDISSLKDIIMPNNHLEGPIPLEFCRLDNLEVLDLTGNNYISGSLPSCFSPPSITQVHLSKNRLEGQLKEAFNTSFSLVTLDLGYNRLDGSIPTWIGRLTNLTYLTLSNNNFEGEVPTQLCKLKQLRLVDISHNNLYGHLPPCLDVTALHDTDHDNVSPSSISMPPVDSPSMPPTVGSNYTSPTPTTAEAPNGPPMRKDETVEFNTKNNSYFYQGKALTGMSGIDLSCNKLTGTLDKAGYKYCSVEGMLEGFFSLSKGYWS
ncbi:hypothetical protein LWI28_017628 [Acer negundo]|uniref:Disease resistance R13L4/SHOC-2-like LRR domain-containing protein n=1 Tax=Acer negundo TaxID=4023 RepID=A0AAD5NGQ4_ACENE|nr:hypothetical protein LWI28_017628 [Acer negundo]